MCEEALGYCVANGSCLCSFPLLFGNFGFSILYLVILEYFTSFKHFLG